MRYVSEYSHVELLSQTWHYLLMKVSGSIVKLLTHLTAIDQAIANTKRKAEDAPDAENPTKRLKQSPTPIEINKPLDTRKQIRIVPFPEKVSSEAECFEAGVLTKFQAWSNRRA